MSGYTSVCCNVKSCLCCTSVSVYYVAVRTIVLSRHGSNLARHVIIHEMALYMCQVLHVVSSIEVLLRPTQIQSDKPSDLRGSLSTCLQCQAVTHPMIYSDRAQTVDANVICDVKRCLCYTSVSGVIHQYVCYVKRCLFIHQYGYNVKRCLCYTSVWL